MAILRECLNRDHVVNPSHTSSRPFLHRPPSSPTRCSFRASRVHIRRCTCALIYMSAIASSSRFPVHLLFTEDSLSSIGVMTPLMHRINERARMLRFFTRKKDIRDPSSCMPTSVYKRISVRNVSERTYVSSTMMYSLDVYDRIHMVGIIMLGSSDADNDITISARVSLSEAAAESERSRHLPSTNRTRVKSNTVSEMLISYISTLA